MLAVDTARPRQCEQRLHGAGREFVTERDCAQRSGADRVGENPGAAELAAGKHG